MRKIATSVAMVGAITATIPAFASSASAASTNGEAAKTIASVKPDTVYITCVTSGKIRTGPSTSYTALGVCAAGDILAETKQDTAGQPITCSTGAVDSTWFYGTDTRTGVTGWVTNCVTY